MSETQYFAIIFWILDPFGMSGVRNPTFRNYFWDFGPGAELALPKNGGICPGINFGAK